MRLLLLELLLTVAAAQDYSTYVDSEVYAVNIDFNLFARRQPFYSSAFRRALESIFPTATGTHSVIVTDLQQSQKGTTLVYFDLLSQNQFFANASYWHLISLFNQTSTLCGPEPPYGCPATDTLVTAFTSNGLPVTQVFKGQQFAESVASERSESFTTDQIGTWNKIDSGEAVYLPYGISTFTQAYDENVVAFTQALAQMLGISRDTITVSYVQPEGVGIVLFFGIEIPTDTDNSDGIISSFNHTRAIFNASCPIVHKGCSAGGKNSLFVQLLNSAGLAVADAFYNGPPVPSRKLLDGCGAIGICLSPTIAPNARASDPVLIEILFNKTTISDLTSKINYDAVQLTARAAIAYAVCYVVNCNYRNVTVDYVTYDVNMTDVVYNVIFYSTTTTPNTYAQALKSALPSNSTTTINTLAYGLANHSIGNLNYVTGVFLVPSLNRALPPAPPASPLYVQQMPQIIIEANTKTNLNALFIVGMVFFGLTLLIITAVVIIMCVRRRNADPVRFQRRRQTNGGTVLATPGTNPNV